MVFSLFDNKKRQEEFIESIIIFVYNHLCKWRDNPLCPSIESEKRLNVDFTKFLTTNYAQKNEIGVIFYPEEPQENQRTVDFSVCLNNVEYYNKIITVFECKRLSTKITGKRKDEYVTGHKKVSGGVQRFKLEVHGEKYEIAGMIGYVQTGTCSEWLELLNNCIDTLSNKPDENGLCWSKNEHINTIEHDEENGKFHGKSLHSRKTKPDITLHHLWINM